jgi:hypothetical protein
MKVTALGQHYRDESLQRKMGSEEAKISEQKWRYTWESQSHIPKLHLLLYPFSKTLINPSLNLTVHLH